MEKNDAAPSVHPFLSLSPFCRFQNKKTKQNSCKNTWTLLYARLLARVRALSLSHSSNAHMNAHVNSPRVTHTHTHTHTHTNTHANSIAAKLCCAVRHESSSFQLSHIAVSPVGWNKKKMEIEEKSRPSFPLSLSLTHTRNRGLQVVCVAQAKATREPRYSRHSTTEREIPSLSLETVMHSRDIGSMKTESKKGEKDSKECQREANQRRLRKLKWRQ